MVWDETRQLGTDAVFVDGMSDMVRQHRNVSAQVICRKLALRLSESFDRLRVGSAPERRDLFDVQ